MPEGVKSLETLENQVATAVADQIVSLFPSGNPLSSPQKTFEYIGSKARGFIVIIDHGERISDSILSLLIEKIKKFGVQLLIASRYNTKMTKDLILFKSLSLSLQETQDFIEYETSKDLIDPINFIDAFAKTGGNPLKLCQLILNKDSEYVAYNSKYSKLLKALSASFGFIDIDIFSETFNIDRNDISKYRTKNVGSREKEKNWVEKD
ncbi:MAG: hypothetical protein KA717_11790 [Woronichinia naegeliana WA131]|uniref:Uncharacterized protein n=1 Tax=Woronichinia naegeliana WA131 TaxID=2824559 RepID=A0A977L0D7_9CYAN|nr:MAG: hypothetical protein KA717_11790 [Woronichinia naegeliana WA131]